MHESTATTPDALKASASDPVLRHRHLVDADILEQTMDSLVSTKLRSDHHGNIVTFPEAGKRRIDYIMSRKGMPVVSVSYSVGLIGGDVAQLVEHHAADAGSVP